MLKEAGRYDGARGAYRAALALEDENADLWLSLGHLHLLRGDQPAAVRAYAASGRHQIAPNGSPSSNIALHPDLRSNYTYWIAEQEAGAAGDDSHMRGFADGLAYKPSFSFVLPVYDTPVALLRECIDSLLSQVYPDFEICIADDHSADPAIAEILQDYARQDARVRYVIRARNGHISAASNTALALASGEFVVLIDHDDVVPRHCLAVVAWYLNRFPSADVLYSDEDKIDLRGVRSSPYFKGDFNRFLAYGQNAISHLGVYRRALVEAVGGFRPGLEGSQDYDLFLRCYERSGDARIIHIPHVLYHWRILPGSTALAAGEKSYAAVAAREAIDQHLARTGLPFRAAPGALPGLTDLNPSHAFETPLSIIVSGGDEAAGRACGAALRAGAPGAVEIILAGPRSADRAGALNAAAAMAGGTILGFVDADLRPEAGDWPNRVRALLDVAGIAVAGGRIIAADGRLESAGLVLGAGEHGVAAAIHGGIDASDPGYFGKARLMQECSALPGGCLFIRKDAFARVGGFDKALPGAYGSVDLSLKIRAAGFKLVVDPRISFRREAVAGASDTSNLANPASEAAEAAVMRARWGDALCGDRYFSPNLALDTGGFAFAFPPRMALPWR